MATKEPRTNSKEIKDELQGQGRSVSDHTIHHCLSQSELHGRRQRTRLHGWKQIVTKREFVKMHTEEPRSFWEHVLLDETKLELFCKSHQLYGHSKSEAFKNKNTTYCCCLLGLPFCIWHWVSWICAGSNKISRLSRHSGVKSATHWKLGRSQVMSPSTG